MGYQTKFDGSTDRTIKLTGGENPTSIEGYFLGSKDVQSDFGPGKLHIFQTADGTVGVWGKTRLNNLLTSDLKGQMVLAEFTGMIAPSKKGRRPSYGYKVQHDPSNVIDTSSVNLNAATEAEDAESADTYESESYEEPETLDEVVAAPPKAPVAPKALPDADRKARMQALLNKKPLK